MLASGDITSQGTSVMSNSELGTHYAKEADGDAEARQANMEAMKSLGLQVENDGEIDYRDAKPVIDGLQTVVDTMSADTGKIPEDFTVTFTAVSV